MRQSPNSFGHVFLAHREQADVNDIVKMGGWKLEAFKMVVYMTFPVSMFYIFNRPEYFEKWTVKIRRELYPPEDKMHKEEIQSLVEKFNSRRDQEMLALLEKGKAK